MFFSSQVHNSFDLHQKGDAIIQQMHVETDYGKSDLNKKYDWNLKDVVT
jgi:hypothetical protein